MASSSSSSSSMKLSLFLVLSSLFIHACFGREMVCEELTENVCAFSIASSGKRCVLETHETTSSGSETEYECRTSEVMVEGMSEYIESDGCVKACGLRRKLVGISSDALLEPQVTAKLCSPSCFNNCPNIVDLYFNLAAGEGVFLPDLCERQRISPHRAMIELLSSGSVAPGPTVSEDLQSAPAPSPF